MSVAASCESPVGVFGGTFNPVHYGHLRSALELVEQLQLAQLRLMPCAQPVHREQPECSSEHRAAMVELAVAGEPRLSCDRRELKRQGPSYTVDSLAEIRQELGPDRSLVMVVGCDAVLAINTWMRWQSLPDYAHIVVIARPGWAMPVDCELGRWLSQRQLEGPAALGERPCGGVLVERLRPLDISSTEIRAQLRQGLSPRYLIPESVLGYIEAHTLYQRGTGRL